MFKNGKLIFCIFCLVWVQTSSAELFRWVDDNGKVHYGDQVPAKDTEKGREILNEGGRVIDKVDRARTPEEIVIYEEEQRKEKIKKAHEERQYARDRALLATFTSVTDLENSRDERVALLEQTIEIARGRLDKQQSELTKLENSRRNFIENEEQVPDWLKNNAKQLSVQISVIEEYILDRDLEKNKIKKKFDRDITRFLELTDHDLSVR